MVVDGFTNVGTLSSKVKSWTSTCMGCQSIEGASTAEKPEIVYRAVNGLPAIGFGSTQWAIVNADLDSAATIIVVQKSSCSHPICNVVSNEDGMFLFGRSNGAGLKRTCFTDARVNGQTAQSFPGTAQEFTVTTLRKGSSEDGTCKFDRLGKSGDDDAWHGQIAELLIWQTELADSDVYKVEDYLLSKYNVGDKMCNRFGVSNVGGSESVHLGTYPQALDRVINAAGGSGFFRGDVAEVVVFDHALSDSERTTVERSMCLRWRDGCAFLSLKVDLEGLSEEFTNSEVIARLVEGIAVGGPRHP